jgi:hypothetical protein
MKCWVVHRHNVMGEQVTAIGGGDQPCSSSEPAQFCCTGLFLSCCIATTGYFLERCCCSKGGMVAWAHGWVGADHMPGMAGILTTFCCVSTALVQYKHEVWCVMLHDVV